MSRPALRDRISVYRGSVAVVFLFGAIALVLVLDGPMQWSIVLLCGAVAVFLLASAVNRVRAHRLYDLVSAVFTLCLIAALFVSTGSDSAFLLTLAGLALLGVAVETYNYRNGTSYLRIDFGGRTDSQ